MITRSAVIPNLIDPIVDGLIYSSNPNTVDGSNAFVKPNTRMLSGRIGFVVISSEMSNV